MTRDGGAGCGSGEQQHDLRHHGDVEATVGLLDCAVNVRSGTPPAWLRAAVVDAVDGLGRYPDQERALAAVARRHGRPADDVLLTAGAAEAFVLLARALPLRRAVVVHPQFTEPEAALRAAGHAVTRVLLDPDCGFRLDPALVPEDADLVVVGNPTNPTGVLHGADELRALARPGRVLVVDEAFMDFVPGECASLASASGVPGLVVVRSLTKMWSLAGLRVGYLLTAPELVGALREAQPLWAVSTPGLAAVAACTTSAALAEATAAAAAVAAERERYAAVLAAVPRLDVVPGAAANFLLVRTADRPDVHRRLRTLGIAVRRGDTFPGLGPEWVRVTVRDPATNDRVATALAGLLTR